MALHGRVTVERPRAGRGDGADADVRGEERSSSTAGPSAAASTSCCAPSADRNAQDHLLDGRRATIERIYVDYDDDVHLGVTVDDDPGQDLMRDIGRYLYFKPDEVEVAGP